ncbi:MAG: acetate--CoA ligase family protein [Candidatus Hydrogenedentes bacterium]|nr:acetate--CoA ligase family protein [Candidatus Hydrogenedentota bacterium]
MSSPSEKNFILDEKIAIELLSKYKVPFAPTKFAVTSEEIITYANEIGYPITLKGLVEGIEHKSDYGLVINNIMDENHLTSAIHRLIKNSNGFSLNGFLIQKYIPGKRELIIGAFRHNHYGDCIYIGTGGILVEVLEDVSFRNIPISFVDLQEMIHQLKCRKIFDEFRGEPPINLEQLFSMLKSLENLFSEESSISQIELNPVVIRNASPVAVDVLAYSIGTSYKLSQSPLEDFETTFDLSQLRKLFEPQSIAIVGITDSPLKWGFRVLLNTLEGKFKGKIYGVNPKRQEMLGIPCYPTVKDIPDPVDLAVIIVPPINVIKCIEDCIEKGIKTILVITAGFGELPSEDAKRAQEKLKELAHTHKLCIIGPNCAGVVSPSPTNLFCSMVGRYPLPGKLSILSQSGNIGATIMNWAQEHNLGIANFISTGNEAVVRNYHYLEYFNIDERTESILAYIETEKDILKFFRTLGKVSRRKPVIVIKGGRTKEGSKAASSHTGALATDYRLFKNLCIQHGGILVEDIYEAIETAHILQNLPLPNGRNVGILAQGGGWGVITADACTNEGLNVVVLSEETINKLDKIMPSWWNRNNPVDMVAGTNVDLFKNAFEVMINAPEVDILVILGIGYVAQSIPRFQNSTLAQNLGLDKLAEIGLKIELRDAEFIRALMQETKKPVLIASDTTILSRGSTPNPVIKRLETLGLYVFQSPISMARALANLCKYSEYLRGIPRKS